MQTSAPLLPEEDSILYLSLTSAALYAIISAFGLLPDSWGLIASILVSSVAGAFFIKDGTEEGMDGKNISGYSSGEVGG